VAIALAKRDKDFFRVTIIGTFCNALSRFLTLCNDVTKLEKRLKKIFVPLRHGTRFSNAKVTVIVQNRTEYCKNKSGIQILCEQNLKFFRAENARSRTFFLVLTYGIFFRCRLFSLSIIFPLN
jgi:hypothetical protein